MSIRNSLRSNIGIGNRLEHPCMLSYLMHRAYDVVVRVFPFLLRVDSRFDLLVSAPPHWVSYPTPLLEKCDCSHDPSMLCNTPHRGNWEES